MQSSKTVFRLTHGEAPSRSPDSDRGAEPCRRHVWLGVKVLLAVSRLLLAHPEVAELDINPLRATSAGLYALDALVILES